MQNQGEGIWGLFAYFEEKELASQMIKLSELLRPRVSRYVKLLWGYPAGHEKCSRLMTLYFQVEGDLENLDSEVELCKCW